MTELLSLSAALSQCPINETVPDAFHKIFLDQWSDEKNDSECIAVRYIKRGEELPNIITFDGRDYKIGQCSGLSYRWVTYDLMENVV